jgi:hypothetical protein
MKITSMSGLLMKTRKQMTLKIVPYKINKNIRIINFFAYYINE